MEDLSLFLVIKILVDTSPLKKNLLMLEHRNEDRRIAILMIEAAKTQLKSHYDSHVHQRTFSEGDLVLIYDQSHDNIGKGKFESMWYGPSVIH